MANYYDFEEEKVKIFAIVDRPTSEYFWYTAQELSRPGVKRIALSATNPHTNTMEHLIRIWAHFGVEVIEGTRGRQKLINPKRGESIDVNFAILERSDLLES